MPDIGIEALDRSCDFVFRFIFGEAAAIVVEQLGGVDVLLCVGVEPVEQVGIGDANTGEEEVVDRGRDCCQVVVGDVEIVEPVITACLDLCRGKLCPGCSGGEDTEGELSKALDGGGPRFGACAAFEGFADSSRRILKLDAFHADKVTARDVLVGVNQGTRTEEHNCGVPILIEEILDPRVDRFPELPLVDRHRQNTDIVTVHDRR